MRKQRTRLRAEISEEKAAEFLDRIALGSHFVAECRFVGFVRLVQALPIAAKLPAVARAADACLGRDAVSERGATMRTKLGDQPEPTLPVLEENEIFAEQPHALCPFVRHFHCSGDRLPVAPQQITSRRSRSNACQHVVLLGSQHGSFPFAVLPRPIATRHRFATVNRIKSPSGANRTSESFEIRI